MTSTDITNISPYGLFNYGNTCYINAALQIIMQIFSDFFSSGEYYKNISSDEKIITFMSDFAHMVSAVENRDSEWTNKHVHVYLQKVIAYLSKLDDFKIFIKYKQADSYEFLLQLISLLSEYLSYKISIDIDVKVDQKELDEKDKTRLVFYTFLQKTMKKTSYIEEMLRGYFRASITCAYEDCNYCSEKFEPFLALSLPIKDMNTLEECLEDYIKPITLDEDNKWYCEKCKRKSQAIKKMSIWSTGKYIIISYKRYVNMLNTSIKDGRPIQAPFQELDMSPYVEDNKKNIYNLCAITVHNGNMNNGHYIAARKIKNNWIVFNDDTVNQVRESNINNKSSYYLVYRRQ